MTLSQSGTSVQGSLLLGSLLINVSGPVSSDGSLALNGQGNVPGGTITLTMWRSVLGAATMTGSFTYSIFIATGSVQVGGALQGVIKTA